MKLNDKVALVLGSTSGIGEAIAIRFAAEGANVAVVGSSHLTKAAGWQSVSRLQEVWQSRLSPMCVTSVRCARLSRP